MKHILFTVLFLITSLTQLAFAQPKNIENQTDEMILSFIDLVYTQAQSDSFSINEYKTVIKFIEDNKNSLENHKYHYYMALTEFYAGKIHQLFDNPQIVINHNREMRKGKYKILKTFYNEIDTVLLHFHKALKHIELALNNNNCADYLTLKGAIIGDLCLVDSFSFMFKNGIKVSKMAKKALKMDPNNFSALFLIIAAKTYPPKIYGGDPMEANKMLLSLNKDKIKEKHFHFDIQMALAYNYGRLQESELANYHIKQALFLYPKNNFALGIERVLANKEF